MIQDRSVFIIADQYQIIYGLSNGAIFSDLERSRIHISRSRHSLTLNILETAKDTAIVAIKCRQETVPKLSNSTISNDSNPDIKVSILFNVK